MARLTFSVLLLVIPAIAAEPRTAGLSMMQMKQSSASKNGRSDSEETGGAESLNDTASDMAAVFRELRLLQEKVAELSAKVETCCNGPPPTSQTTTQASTTAATTTTTTGLPSLCAAFGDPHYITFDGAHTTYVGDMIQWIVKSHTVWLQALSRGSEGKFMGFAAGGPFMQGHVLVVYNASDGGPLRALFDGVPILQESSSEHFVPNVMEAYRTESWNSSLFNEKILDIRTKMAFSIGPFPERFLSLPTSGLYLFKLPSGVEVTLTGVDFMSAVIQMSPQEGGQSGYCGNFNGEPDDDAEPIAPSWDRPIGNDLDQVPASMVLFPEELSLLGRAEAPKKVAVVALEKTLEACPPELLEKAQAKCKELNQMLHQDCVFDICRTGDLGAASALQALEIMEEKVNARGLPLFVGHGECLDMSGRRYRAFPTKLRTNAQCLELLRDLALMEGIMGAQLQRGSTCEILVQPGADPTSAAIKRGWAAPTLEAAANGTGGHAEVEHGEGIISGTTKDAGWNCWQLD